MTFIQPSLMETHQVSLVSPVKKSDNDDGFEAILDAVVLNEAAPIATQPLDLNNLIEGSADDLLTLESDICVLEQLMMRGTAEPEQIQSAPVNLTREHVQKEVPAGIPALKKNGLHEELDGTEVDPSMMIPLVPMDVRSNPVALVSSVLKVDNESLSLHADLKDGDSQEPSINLETIDFCSINPRYGRVGSKEDLSTVLSDKETLTIESTKETTLPLSISKEVVSHDPVVELMPTAQSVSEMTDKSAIRVGSIPSKMTAEIQSNDDTLMEEVPIVSIALKRDPVMLGMPVKKLDSAPKNENLMVDQTDVSKPKISDDVIQVVKPAGSKKESLEFDSEEVEPLLESSVKEAVIKPIQIAAALESSEVVTDVNLSKPAPSQQIQQAILDAKEGVSPKESKTLTVVLNPEELGIVNVELRSDEMGKLSAVLSVEKRETLDVLQQDLHQLKTVLKEIGIDESSISLQLSSNNEHGQQKQSEYVAWEEREHMLMRSQQAPVKAAVEKATYPERQSTRRLDIKA